MGALTVKCVTVVLSTTSIEAVGLGCVPAMEVLSSLGADLTNNVG